MPSYWTAYKSRPKIMDVTVTACKAGTTKFDLPQSGSVTGSNAAAVNNSINSLVDQTQRVDALLAVVTSPIVDPVTFPDCKLWFSNGTHDLSTYQVFDVGYAVNMLPDLRHVDSNPEVQQVLLLLGMSTRDLLRQVKGGLVVPNLPTLITGYKVTDSLTAHIASSAGWSSAMVPMRVEVYADFLTETDVAEFLGMTYDGSINFDIPPTEPFTATHNWPGLGTMSGWGQGPGGNEQQGPTTINRRVVYAYNAVDATGRFVFSTKNGVNGVAGNVSSADTTDTDQVHDLGEVFSKNSNSAVFIDRVGFNLYAANQQAYVAWAIGKQLVPQETEDGKVVSSNVNDLAYGHDTTTGGAGNRTRTLVNADNLARILMYRNAVAPTAKPVSGTIAAGDMSFAYAGVQMEVA